MTAPTPGPVRPRVVFLIGSPRSGTTWLQSLLGSHAEVVTPQETDLFATFIAPLQGWWDELLGRSADDQKRRRAKGLPAVIDDAAFTAMIADFVDRVLGSIAALDPAATVIVEKSPAHSHHTELIARYLPDAEFVHIVRDGRDVAESLRNAARGWGSFWVTGNLKRAALSWRTSVDDARLARATGRYTEVRYEQLRSGDPEPLRQAFAACGLDVATERCAALLREYSLEQMKSGATASPITLGGEMGRRHGQVDEPAGFYGTGAVGGWTETWSGAERLLFDAVTGDRLVELGYERDHAWAGSPLRRRAYRAQVAVQRNLARLGRRIGRRSQRLLARLPD